MVAGLDPEIFLEESSVPERDPGVWKWRITAGRLRVPAHCPEVYENMVALTGIEPADFQFSSVQLGLSECK
jgi:hypothetical protein